MKYTAIIIEPRIHNALQFVLNNFFTNLDNDWSFIIFYGNKNKDYLFKIIKENFLHMIDRIKLINLQIDNLSIIQYCFLLYDEKFYDLINTEYFLIFQTDTIIRTKFKYFINSFLIFDYVGAPWLDPFKTFNKHDANNVGNGGLSLRKKSKMLEIIKKNFYFDNCKHLPEDYFFTRKYDNIKLNVPKIEYAKFFSVESIYNSESFGVHKPWFHLSKEDYESLIEISPEVHELKLLNDEYNKNNKKEYNSNRLSFNFIEEKLNKDLIN
jgi:hypothetical protein